jgi:exosortase
LIWLCWPTLVELSRLWTHDPKYSHGYLVPIFALFLFWYQGRLSPESAITPSWWGIPLLLSGLLVRWIGTYLYFPALTGLSLLPLIAGVVVCVGGGTMLANRWASVAFLAFMLPLPYRLETALARPLQSLATETSAYVLQTLGFAAYTEGNIICLRDQRVNVAEACNGLSMIMMFIAISAAVVLLSRRPSIERAIILFSAIPIALVCNIARIAASALMYVHFGRTLGECIPFTNSIAFPGRAPLGALDLHDLNGYLMMPLALALLWIEIKALNWIFPSPPALVGRSSLGRQPERRSSPLRPPLVRPVVR